MICDIIELLKNDLHKAGIEIEGEIRTRLKEPYSVLKKMKRKNVLVTSLKDLIACRVIVKSKDDCYHALRIIRDFMHLELLHTKDYIYHPKSNGYQSIHSIMQFLYSNRHVEVQIRSRDMHNEAELGRAAHLNYKEEQGRHLKDNFDSANDTILNTARKMLEQFKGFEEQIVEYEKEIMRIWHTKYAEVQKWEKVAKVFLFNKDK